MAEHAPTGWKSAPERAQIQDELQEARAEADHAKADQVHMVRDVSMMFNELRALADRHTALHSDRARLEAELERERAGLVRARQSWWQRLLGLKRLTSSRWHWRLTDRVGCAIIARRSARPPCRASKNRFRPSAGRSGGRVRRPGFRWPCPHGRCRSRTRAVEQRLLPGMDLARVDTELAGQFANRAVALECRQGNLRLERRAVFLPRLLH